MLKWHEQTKLLVALDDQGPANQAKTRWTNLCQANQLSWLLRREDDSRIWPCWTFDAVKSLILETDVWSQPLKGTSHWENGLLTVSNVWFAEATPPRAHHDFFARHCKASVNVNLREHQRSRSMLDHSWWGALQLYVRSFVMGSYFSHTCRTI